MEYFYSSILFYFSFIISKDNIHLIKNRIVHAAFFSAKRTRGYRGPVPQLRPPAEEALQVLPPVRPPGHGAGESDNGHLLLKFNFKFN